MVGKAGSGRRPGFTHSEETKEKMRLVKVGKPRSEEDRESISKGRKLSNLDVRCSIRLMDLRDNYPEEKEFFTNNREKLLFAMRDVRTDKELDDIRRYIETAPLRSDEPYQYASTSCYAAEDAVIALLDFKRSLQKNPTGTASF